MAYKDLYKKGDVINNLKLMSGITAGKEGQAYAQFLCLCGNLFNSRVYAVINKHTNSCGCLARKMAADKRIRYEPGVMFGNIRFLEEIESVIHKPSVGRFLCFCGKPFESRINSVKSGSTESCGCSRKAVIIDYLKGEKIGEFVFLNRVASPKGRPMANFLCGCGNQFITRIENAKSGRTKSCGCKTKEFLANASRGIDRSGPASPVKKMPLLSDEHLQKFWDKITITANHNLCWNWTATGNRYGSFNVNGSQYKSNRLAYYIHYNEDPLEMEVMHSCDNQKCCNPHHLALGTHRENMQSMKERGRAKKNKSNNSTINKQ